MAYRHGLSNVLSPLFDCAMSSVSPPAVRPQPRPARLPSRPAAPRISHDVIHDSDSDDGAYAPIPFLGADSSSYEYYSDSDGAAAAAEAAPAPAPAPPAAARAPAPRPPPRRPSGAPVRPIPRRPAPPAPEPAESAPPAPAPAPAPAAPRYSFSTVIRVKKISIKGARFAFALWALGREALSARFANSDAVATIAQGAQSFAFLRGEHDVHFALRAGSQFGDDIWSMRFTGATRDGARMCALYFLRDAPPGVPPSLCACTAPEECRAAIARIFARAESPYTANRRNVVLVGADDAREPVAAFGKLIGGGYGVACRAEVNPLIVFAFGMAAWLSPRNPK
jgi:hypothetical protein